MKPFRTFVATALLLVQSEFAEAKSQVTVNVADVDKAVHAAMAQFDIPGIAIAVVENDQVVLSKGYGVRDIVSGAKVDEYTLFGIASNSKAFTAASIAMLIDDGKLSWDDKVTQHLPEFRLYDEYATAHMTIRDLLSHRSGLGLGAGDLMIWPDTDKSVQDIIQGLQHIPPASSFRSEYAYNNLMFVVAGEVIARVSGVSWREFVERRIFKTLGMEASKAGFSRIEKDNKNWATGNIPDNGKLTPFFVDYLQDFRGAGAIASNVDDMSKWLLTQLAAGKTQQGAQLYNAEHQVQMWHPHIMRLPKQSSFDAYRQQFRGYGLGWAIEDYFGYKKLGHGGGILGMVSQVAMIPEKKLGVVVLSNQQAYPALTAIIHEVFEDALGRTDKDWVTLLATEYKLEKTKLYAEAGVVSPAVKQAPLPLQYYTGTLTSQWYGDVIVESLDGKLRIDFTHTKMLKGQLEHVSGNQFVIRWDEQRLEADAYIYFQLNKEQAVSHATMEFVNPDISDFSFDFHDLKLMAK
ncbi:serine hydrolase [Pseudoalteromonas sp. MMG013]|uniref:serine hydrolase n=1 Tax=Pseudoalteromonas sp. MMG013 TaxID=2822687 RepID=UPI001B38FF1D|nr:serine hydrolase [Pseudoalteromonas sp. MMG013]MBQ4861186.1 serine hydrolase [Pseudoalteromonas sp. MMG013]